MSIDTDADLALHAVAQALRDIPSFHQVVVTELRRALDEVIDGPRTGRYSIDQLEKTEKTYIGTKVEILLRHALELQRGAKLDNLIAGTEVDTKFSISSQWMIPKEAIGEICLLVGVDEKRSICRVGLLRTTESVLRPGQNQDAKRGISAQGKEQILWLLADSPIPENFLLHLDDATRNAILAPKSGKKRVEALFTHITGRLLSRSLVLQVIRLPGDPLKRAREAKATLKPKGFNVLCATYQADRQQMSEAGFNEFAADDWLSLRVEPT
jgi:Restriction endonuclease NaeI